MKNEISIDFNASSPEQVFNLGEIFVSSKRIKLKNYDKIVDLIKQEQENGIEKSFNRMAAFWANYSLSVSLNNIPTSPKNLFLICPIRNATESSKENLKKIIAKYEDLGYHVHYPARNTNQNPFVNKINTGGFNICLENARAIAAAQTVVIYYDNSSIGSAFDLGVAYSLAKLNPERKFIVENEKDVNPLTPIGAKIQELLNLSRSNAATEPEV